MTVLDGETLPVLAATAWPTNAHLVEACVDLRYLYPDDLTLDPTYGKGRWWTRFRPHDLVTYNRQEDGSDFRHLDEPDGRFDVVAYDPPYVCVGGRETSGIAAMYESYGQLDAPATPAELQALINDGLTEMHRVVKPRGRVLVKCQDYVSSGRLWLGTHHTTAHALALGFEVVDRLEHIGGRRPQPPGRRQMHARRNLSTLLVLRKARK